MLEFSDLWPRTDKSKGAERLDGDKDNTTSSLRREILALLGSSAFVKRLKEPLDYLDIEPLESGEARARSSGKPLRLDAKPDAKEANADDPAATKKVAESYRRQGLKELEGLHRDLPTTKPLAYIDKHKLTGSATPLQIARQHLGKAAPIDQVRAYAQEICWLNDLGEKSEGKPLAKGRVIKLPGMDSKGGFVSYKSGNRVVAWPDGSRYERHEDGRGLVVIPLAGEREKQIRFDPNNRADNVVAEFKGDKLLKHVFVDKKGRTVTEDEFKLGRAGRMRIVDDAKREEYVLTLGADGHYHGIKKKNGKVVDRNAGFDPDKEDYRDISLYSQTEVKDGKKTVVTRTYEDGATKTFDRNNELLSETRVDKLGRTITGRFRPGENDPYEYEITLKEKGKPVTFKLPRSPAGIYSAPHVVDGKTVGTVEYTPATNQILFLQGDKKRGTATLEDGTQVERIILDGGGHKVIKTKGKESLATTYDIAGKPILEECTYSSGTKVSTFTQPGGKPYKVEVKEPGADGATTLVELDKATGVLKGFRRDAKGTKLEAAYLHNDTLIYKDLKTGKIRAEDLQEPEDKGLLPVRKKCTVDVDRGTLSFERKGQTIITPMSGGREDKIEKDGTISGTTILGTRSYARRDGEAAVMHADLTGVRLNRDNTIDRWGPKPSENARGEQLGAAEARFLMQNKDVDRRDIAEIHRRFAGEPAKLERFYNNLIALTKDDRIPAAKRDVIKANILSDVASGVAYQGSSPTCNTTVIQQEMLDGSPDTYVKTLHTAFATGELKTFDGKTVSLDRENLYMADSTGRNLCSRAFQTLSAQVLYDGRRVVRNHEDGTLRLYREPYNKDDVPKIFTGLNLAQIAELRYRLTGQEKSVCLVENVSDLIAAFEKHNKIGKGMTISVFPQKPPFVEVRDAGPDSTDGGHVLTITRIERGDPEKGIPTKVYVKNQWGLAADHQTDETAFKADELLKNMKQAKLRVDGTVKTFGEVLIDGQRQTGYRMIDGKAVADPFATRAIRREKNMVLEK